jgi:Holliday junction resolvase RusA-like endonuclease
MLLEVVLPLPDKKLSPNARPHYMALHKAKKKARFISKAETLDALHRYYREFGLPFKKPLLETAEIKRVFFFKVNRRRDPDNLDASTKAYIDGLRDAGLLADDDKITYLPTEVNIDKERPRLVLKVWDNVF